MQKVILVGFMGSGKSTLAKKLAAKLSLPFIDSDKAIEAHYNKSIGELFAEHGESHFRDLERHFIETLNTEENFVLATGGGLPCFGKNMEVLNNLGATFYLERSPKELAHRLINSKEKRPLLEGLSEEELLHFISEKLAQREEYYRLAHFTLDRDEQDAETICNLVHLLQPLQKS